MKIRLSYLSSPHNRNEKFIKYSDRKSHRKIKPRRLIYTWHDTADTNYKNYNLPVCDISYR